MKGRGHTWDSLDLRQSEQRPIVGSRQKRVCRNWPLGFRLARLLEGKGKLLYMCETLLWLFLQCLQYHPLNRT